MGYKAAGKAWLDSVVKDQEEAYIKLFDKLMELGSPYIDNFDQADREQVFKCIRDKTGRFLDDDNFVTYVETEEEKEKPKYILTGDAKIALTDYYNAIHTLSEAQQNFAKSTQVLEKKIDNKSIFLDIIKQVQLPSVSAGQDSGRKGEDGRQDLHRVDIDVPPTKLQKDQPQCQGTNQNDGRIHLLYPVRTDHWHKGITDRLRHRFQMSDDTIQETDNREETTWRTRQVKRGERKIQQKPGRSRQNGRPYSHQENKEREGNNSNNNINTQEWKLERLRQKELGG